MFEKVVVKLNHIFQKIFAFGAGFCMFMVFLIIFVNSTRRYLFGKSFEWGEQLPVFIAIYGIMFGIAWAYMSDKHISFSVLVDILPKRFTTSLHVVVDMAMICTGVVFAYSGYLFASKRGFMEVSGLINSARRLQELSGVESLVVLGKMYPYQLSMAVGGAMLVVASILRLFSRFCELKKGAI